MILWNLLSCAWSTPTPVQALTLPSEGASDFVVLCDTGDTDDTDDTDTDPPDPPPPPPEPVRPAE